MQILKDIHVFCAYATGLGFLLRGTLALVGSRLTRHKLTRILPHIIDTCLLASGILMVYSWSVSFASQSWLVAKLIALLIYIAFGLLMLRWGRTTGRRWIGLGGGLLVYLYIIGVAHSKSVFSMMAFV